MADDVARKLNAINEDYNARTVSVFSGGGNYTFSNIERKFIDEDTSQVESNDTNDQNTTNESDNTVYVEDDEKFDITNVLGNHAVVLMDIPNEDITLVVDPTNIGIGIFQNGKITMFNSYKENPLEIKMKPLGAAIWGTEDLSEVPSNYINSLGSKDIEELRKIWGVEAQNKALDEVREEFKTNKEQFNESLKYDVANNNSTNNIDNEKNQNKEIESER